MAVATTLMTAEEFARLPNTGRVRELVRGKVVEMNQPYPRHGQVCVKLARLVGNFADEHELGHVVSNDSGIVTEHDPDTVRGGDVCFFSYQKVPRGPLPQRYLDVVPDIVFEVLSPSDRVGMTIRKVAEYLNAGVAVVCVLDPDEETIVCYSTGGKQRILSGEDQLTFPEQLPGFSVPVRKFFE